MPLKFSWCIKKFCSLFNNWPTFHVPYTSFQRLQIIIIWVNMINYLLWELNWQNSSHRSPTVENMDSLDSKFSRMNQHLMWKNCWRSGAIFIYPIFFATLACVLGYQKKSSGGHKWVAFPGSFRNVISRKLDVNTTGELSLCPSSFPEKELLHSELHGNLAANQRNSYYPSIPMDWIDMNSFVANPVHLLYDKFVSY